VLQLASEIVVTVLSEQNISQALYFKNAKQCCFLCKMSYVDFE